MYRMDEFLIRFFFTLLGILMINTAFLPDKIHSQSRSTSEFDIRQEFEKRMGLFEEAIRHIQQDNLNELRQMENDVDEAISFLDSWEQARLSIARGIRTRTSSDEQINQLAGEFVDSATEAQSTRSELSMSWPLFVENPSKPDEFVEKIEKLVEDHQPLMEKADEMSQSDVSLPNMSELYGPEQVSLDQSKQCEVKYIVENISSSSWNEVEFRAETTDGNEMEAIWTEPDQITRVSPGKAVAFDLCIDNDYGEEDLVTLKIESEEMSKTETFRITN